MTRDQDHNLSDESQAANAIVGRPLRILVVDDEADSVRSLMLLLRTEGHEVVGAGSAKGMWDALHSLEPDVVLLDINLPDASGYQVARELRRRFGENADTPLLVAITAWNKESDRLLAQIAGFDYHLGKPYAPDRLISIIRSAATATGFRGRFKDPL